MIDRLVARCAAVLTTLCLCACASGSTTIGSNSHGLAIEEFFTTNPRDLRLALRTDDRAKRGPVDPVIVLRASVGSRPSRCYALALVAVDPSAPQQPPLEPPPAHRRWYVFALSMEGVDTFERARREVQPSATEGGNLNFEFALNDVIDHADDPQGSPLRLDFAVDRSAGYFTMSAERTVRPAASRPSGPRPAPCGATA